MQTVVLEDTYKQRLLRTTEAGLINIARKILRDTLIPDDRQACDRKTEQQDKQLLKQLNSNKINLAAKSRLAIKQVLEPASIFIVK